MEDLSERKEILPRKRSILKTPRNFFALSPEAINKKKVVFDLEKNTYRQINESPKSKKPREDDQFKLSPFTLRLRDRRMQEEFTKYVRRQTRTQAFWILVI